MIDSNKDFILKINRYLDNPFKYSLKKLCSEFNLTETEINKIILDNEFLNFKFTNILFSKKTTAEELYQLLLKSIPPVYKSKMDFKIAMENPAFNVTYSFYINDEKTVDYFKLRYEKKLNTNDLNELLMSYLKKSSDLIKKLEIHKIQLKQASQNDFSSYTF
jgi:hypothetical protein